MNVFLEELVGNLFLFWKTYMIYIHTNMVEFVGPLPLCIMGCGAPRPVAYRDMQDMGRVHL